MWLFFLFIGVPIIEIALFIQVGGWLGLWPTLAIVVLTAIAGTMMVRSQGARALANLQRSFSDLNDPTEPLAHGAMILFSGALLLTPGFFTDALGFALLIPAFRNYVMRQIGKRIQVSSVVAGQAQWTGDTGDTVIDGDFEVEEDPNRPPSGWTRH
jgi:UPF0716 protein FxsA